MLGTLDFDSALYLDFFHPGSRVEGWSSLTSGRPVVLMESNSTKRLAHQLARMIGQEQGILYPSTLHLFWDLFAQYNHKPFVIFRDAGFTGH